MENPRVIRSADIIAQGFGWAGLDWAGESSKQQTSRLPQRDEHKRVFAYVEGGMSCVTVTVCIRDRAISQRILSLFGPVRWVPTRF